MEGDELTLIDTGTKTEKALAELRRGLHRHGYALGDIKRVIVTHPHLDHFGLAAQIVSEGEAKVYTHPRSQEWLQNFEVTWGSRQEYFVRIFRQAGVPGPVLELMERARGLMQRYGAAVPVHGLLVEGDTISLADRPWRVIHTPGHASGHICLYQEQEKVLISGDHLLHDITSNPVLEAPLPGETERRRSLVDYLASLQRVSEMEIELVLPAHGEQIRDHRILIAERLEFHRWRMERILEALDGQAKTIYQICQALFPDLPPLEVFLGISEVIGHLDILEEEKRVRKCHCNGLVYYSVPEQN